MKRDFLKGLGIEDKEIIDKILDENSVDIGKAKGNTEELQNKVTALQAEINTKDTQIAELQKNNEDVSKLNQKVKELEADKLQLESDMSSKISDIEKNHAIIDGIREAKGKNTKAIMALLDTTKITYTDGKLDGLSDQLSVLSKDENSSFLFGSVGVPSGTTPSSPNINNVGGGTSQTTLASAIANALTAK